MNIIASKQIKISDSLINKIKTFVRNVNNDLKKEEQFDIIIFQKKHGVTEQLLNAIASTKNLNIDKKNILAYLSLQIELKDFPSLNNINNQQLKNNVTIDGNKLKTKLGVLCTINENYFGRTLDENNTIIINIANELGGKFKYSTIQHELTHLTQSIMNAFFDKKNIVLENVTQENRLMPNQKIPSPLNERYGDPIIEGNAVFNETISDITQVITYANRFFKNGRVFGVVILKYLIDKNQIDKQLNHYIQNAETEKQKKNLQYVLKVFERLSKQVFYIQAVYNLKKYQNLFAQDNKLKKYFYNKLYSSLEQKKLIPSITQKKLKEILEK